MAHLRAPGAHTELGGVGIIDTDTLTTSFEAPLHLWSPKGHTAARNPTLLRRTGTELVLEAVPDDGRAALHTWTSPLT